MLTAENKAIQKNTTYCHYIKFRDDTSEFVYANEFFIDGKDLYLYDQGKQVFTCHWEDVALVKRLGATKDEFIWP